MNLQKNKPFVIMFSKTNVTRFFDYMYFDYEFFNHLTKNKTVEK